jgi:hypothetical protein
MATPLPTAIADAGIKVHRLTDNVDIDSAEVAADSASTA